MRFPSRERPVMPNIDAQDFVIAENDGEVVQGVSANKSGPSLTVPPSVLAIADEVIE
jgi:hypothetical protein